MPRKKKRPEKYYGKTEEEWREWGEEFGDSMQKWGEEFGRRMERRQRRWHHEGREFWYRSFGFVGPLIGSIFGLIGIGLAIIILKILNVFVGSTFIVAVYDFLFNYLPLLFAIFLFSGYNEYFSKRYWKHYWIVSPITVAISVAIALWFAVWALNLLNTIPQTHFLATAANLISTYLPTIFVIFVVVGYIAVFMNKIFWNWGRY